MMRTVRLPGGLAVTTTSTKEWLVVGVTAEGVAEVDYASDDRADALGQRRIRAATMPDITWHVVA